MQRKTVEWVTMDIIKENFGIPVKVVICQWDCSEKDDEGYALALIFLSIYIISNFGGDLCCLFVCSLRVTLTGAAQIQALEGVEVIAKLKAKKML